MTEQERLSAERLAEIKDRHANIYRYHWFAMRNNAIADIADLLAEVERLQARLDFVASYFEISEEDIDQAIDGIEDALIQTIEESGSEPQ